MTLLKNGGIEGFVTANGKKCAMVVIDMSLLSVKHATGSRPSSMPTDSIQIHSRSMEGCFLQFLVSGLMLTARSWTDGVIQYT